MKRILTPFFLIFSFYFIQAQTAFGDVMISQYYEKSDTGFIEVINLSNRDIDLSSEKIYLALFRARRADANGDFYGKNPNVKKDLLNYDNDGIFSPGEIIVWEENNNVIKGRSTLVLSRTNDRSCYENRLDIFGTPLASEARKRLNKSYTKGVCLGRGSKIPHTDFDINDWIELTNEEVDLATANNPAANIAKGAYFNEDILLDGTARDQGTFDRTRSVIISTNILQGDYADIYEACDLTISSGSNFEFTDTNGTSTISLYGNLVIDGIFNIGDDESLIMHDGGTVTYNGSFSKAEKSVVKNAVSDVSYWSSPVENASVTATFPDVNPGRIFQLDPTKINSIYTGVYAKYEHWFAASDASNGFNLFETGKGYSVQGNDHDTYPSQQTVIFTGKPVTGTVNVPISTGIASEEGSTYDNKSFNLIGNPYPSAIDPDMFIEANKGKFTGSIYVWSQRSFFDGTEYQDGGYFTYNLSGGAGTDIPEVAGYKIASGQGFMVVVLEDTSLSFTNAMRVPGENTMFYKSNLKKNTETETQPEKDRFWLQLKNSENTKVRELLIGFFDAATDDEDFGYDALSANDNSFNFYSVLNGKKYSIQGLGRFNTDKSITLGVDAAHPGTYTIRLGKREGTLKNKNIYLTDNLLNITTDLNQTDYSFSLNNGEEFASRFTVHFTNAALAVDDEILNRNFTISQTAGQLKIQSNSPVTRIDLYDMLGRNLMYLKPGKQSFSVDISKIDKGSVLILNAVLDNGSTISKKILRR